MAMSGHSFDELVCNSAGITLITDDKIHILCFLITFMIGPAYVISSKACSAEEQALFATIMQMKMEKEEVNVPLRFSRD